MFNNIRADYEIRCKIFWLHRLSEASFLQGNFSAPTYRCSLSRCQGYGIGPGTVIANLPDSSNLDCAGTGVPIAVMIINGTSDSTNPYNGGEVKIPGTSFGRVRSTDKTFQYWANLDGYSGEPFEEALPDTDPADGKTIEKYSYKATKKPTVVLLKVINGKHDYPNDINAYLEAWAFFKNEMKR